MYQRPGPPARQAVQRSLCRLRFPIISPLSRQPAPEGSASETPFHTFSPSLRLKRVRQIKLPCADTSYPYFHRFLESRSDPGAPGEAAGSVPGRRPVGNDMEMKKLISECAPIIFQSRRKVNFKTVKSSPLFSAIFYKKFSHRIIILLSFSQNIDVPSKKC